MATRDASAFSLPANADLTGKDAHFGKLTGGKVAVCSVLGERADFVIGSEPSAAGQATDVYPRDGRIVEIKVGAVAVAANDELTPDANGLAITAVATNIVTAKALEAGNAGAVIRALWVAAYAKP